MSLVILISRSVGYEKCQNIQFNMKTYLVMTSLEILPSETIKCCYLIFLKKKKTISVRSNWKSLIDKNINV